MEALFLGEMALIISLILAAAALAAGDCLPLSGK